MPGISDATRMPPPTDTQPLSQPVHTSFEDKSAPGREDLTDVIAFLHPTSREAIDAVNTASRIAPQHLRYNAHKATPHTNNGTRSTAQRGVHANGGTRYNNVEATQETQIHEPALPSRVDNALALRFSSPVKDLSMGFTFGRSDNCDILIRPEGDRIKVSNLHFRIFVSNDGIPMIQDCSRNGTWIDNIILRTHEKNILSQGATIEVITWTDSETNSTKRASFTVTFPTYEDPTERDKRRLKMEHYLQQRARHVHGQLPAGSPALQLPRLGTTIASDRDISCGMHWTGAPKYSVQKKIGDGAFATVYLLVTRDGEKVCAAKEIRKKNAFTQELDIKIGMEIAIMKKITHPHVVELFDWVDKGSHLYLIMEYMPCGDLGKYTLPAHSLGEASNQTVAKQVCHALRYIHSLSITHRDIKPDNILVLSWDPLWVKLSDFGLSKMIESDQGAAVMRTFCGTMLYCAPEVFPEYSKLVNAPPSAATVARYDSKVDIWSLGSVFYQLLLHEPAYRSDRDVSAQAMPGHFLRLLLKSRPSFDRKRQHISKEAILFLEMCLQVDPNRRPDARACLGHPWLSDVRDVVSELPLPLDEEVEELSKSTQEILELTDAAEKWRNESQLSYILPPKLNELGTTDYSSEVDSAQLEAFLDYRKTSFDSDIEPHQPPPMPPAPSRPRLFGEVPPVGVMDSGTLGNGRRLNVHSALDSSGDTSSEPAQGTRETMEMHSTVSNVQDLAISAPSAPASPVVSSAMLPPPPQHSAASKRLRDDDSHDQLLTTSKRHMTQENRPKFFGRLVPVPGSIEEAEELVISGPIFGWGRSPHLSHPWPHTQDRRVPITGMDILFWSPQMIDFASRHNINWGKVDLPSQYILFDEDILSGVECYLKTRSKVGISVNGVRLERSTDDRLQVVCLRDGDEIEIYRGANGFLRYRCQMYVGLASKTRPASERTAVATDPDLQSWVQEMIAANAAKASNLR